MSIRRATVIGLLGLVLGAGAAVATPSVGLVSQLLTNGTWSRQERVQFVSALERQSGLQTSNVAVVSATLQPGGSTGWHGHPGPSVVILQSGSLRVSEPTPNGECRISEVSAADGARAFFHRQAKHLFENPSDETVTEFYVVYFAPTGVPLLNDVPTVPSECSGA
jgi:quercetin dioxygenase-like cupin family protein